MAHVGDENPEVPAAGADRGGTRIARPAAAPATTLYLEDFRAGTTYELGERTVSGEEIVRFAADFDRQPFHLDEDAARDFIFGGLVASGWHTCAIFGSLLADGLVAGVANLAGIGLDRVRFTAPVRPGDTLRATAMVERTQPSQSRPDAGVLALDGRLTNQEGVEVWSALCTSLVRRRPGAQ